MKSITPKHFIPGALFVVLLSFILAACDRPQDNLPAEISISWSEIDQSIGLETGSIFEVVLPYDPSTGCLWQAGFYNPSVLEPDGEPEIADAAFNFDTPAAQRMHFKAIGEGETELVLLLKRSEQICDADPNMFEVKVVVR